MTPAQKNIVTRFRKLRCSVQHIANVTGLNYHLCYRVKVGRVVRWTGKQDAVVAAMAEYLKGI
jgi:hypothetical protein